MNILIESPVYSLEAAVKAVEAGVDRLELCSSYAEGGETPSPGLLRYLKDHVDIPVYVMIRPRGGDFFYSGKEVDVMIEEIRILDELGADGFVFGVLKGDGVVDMEANRLLIQAAGRKPCTFHRAIDVSRNLLESVNRSVECGFRRILTSGGRNRVQDGMTSIKMMMEEAGDRLTVMPGGGLEPHHLKPLMDTGYLKEVHASCKTLRPVGMRFSNPEVQFTAKPVAADQILSFSEDRFKDFRAAIEEAE